MAKNPYAVPTAGQRNGTAPPHANVWGKNHRYAVKQPPESTDPDYTTGFSSVLKAGGSPDGSALPDDIRTGKRKTPVPNRNWNDPGFQQRRDSEFLSRHSAEKWKKGWKVRQETTARPNIPIQRQDRLPIRPTATMAPMGTLFQRPWHIPRNIKDALGENAVTHFSLADHKRRYQIFGMKPQGRLGVNSYRQQPRPWDENLYVAPPAGGRELGRISGNRSWRL